MGVRTGKFGGSSMSQAVEENLYASLFSIILAKWVRLHNCWIAKTTVNVPTERPNEYRSYAAISMIDFG